MLGSTTGAGIWVTAALGVCAGMGRATTAILAALLTLAVLALLGRWEDRLVRAGTDERAQKADGQRRRASA